MRFLSRLFKTKLINEQQPTSAPPSSPRDALEAEHAFSQLTQSLAHENQAIVEQMNHLLLMNDAFISTLHLEPLLGEIVSRLGTIMQSTHIALLLYGREMPVPWAVAHWERPTTENGARAQASAGVTPFSGIRFAQAKNISVYADPNRDITLAVTTKMAALPARGSIAYNMPETNTNSAFAPPFPSSGGIEASRTPIPGSALRELDMLLAHLVIQSQKITYGEDVTLVYQESQEHWAELALEMGYHSVIAVPLLLQDQAIGAIMLYAQEPRPIRNHETFLLSSASIQASMAIQNTLLFSELKEKNSALEQANHLKSQFLANVTHELRTPLHSIISYGALLLEGYVEGELSSEQEEHIQFMVRRAEDLSHLVDDMLDLSKIEADRIEMKPEALELNVSLSEVVNQLKPMALNKDLYLNLECDPQVPKVLADSHRLRQIVLNLVSNALKFTEKGGVTIHCQHMPERAQVLISVHDTGIGISPAALGYIFEAFRQADGSTTRRFGGTGLGLTIARKLIELQGGEIAVESIPGRGSTFAFTLPVAAPVSPSTRTPEAQRPLV